MSFVSHVKLHPKHINNMFKSKPISISPADVQGGSIEAQLHFSDKKDMNRLHRNLKNGKSTRLNGTHIKDVMVHDGDGIYSPLGQHEIVGGKLTLKGIGRSIKKGFKKVGSELAPVVKKVGKVAMPILKEIGKNAAPIVSELASEGTAAAIGYATGNPALGKAVGKVVGKAAGKAYQKQVVPLIDKKKTSKNSVVMNPIGIVKSTSTPNNIITPTNNNMNANKNYYDINNLSNKVSKTNKVNNMNEVNKVIGEGIQHTPTNFLGGIKAPSAGFSSPAERMAWVRSHRGKKVGGSMLPLGGSMLPLGGSMMPL